jgi:ABC-2 type transport system permease protein
MKGFYEVFRTESLKATRSKIFWATLLVFAFIAVMMGLLVYVAMHPDLMKNSALLSAKATIIGQADWPAYFDLLLQVVAMIGLIGFGFVAGWVFGREYSDRTAKDMMALPVSRSAIVTSKFALVVVWSVLLAVILFVFGLLTGLLVHIDNWSAEVARHAFYVFMGTSMLTILITTPVAFFASWGRGYLLPIAYIIFTIIFTQLIIAGIPGLGPYFPWAIPALYCGAAGPESSHLGMASYMILGLTSVVGFTGTLIWWRYADQI